MTKKDYEKIAEVLRNTSYLWSSERDTIVDEFVTVLKKDNPKFNAELFRKACGRM